MGFREFPLANGTASSKIPGKEDNVARYTENSMRLSSQKVPEFSVESFALRKFNNFRILWKLFQEIYLPYAPVSEFLAFLVECKVDYMKEYFYLLLDGILVHQNGTSH